MKALILIIVGTALINNVVLNQFLGICSFLGVSKQMKASVSLGGAVIFVITIASAVASLLYTYVLAPLSLDYMKTIVFILVIAALVQIVEMFLKKKSPAIYNALGIYLPLITTNCAVLGVALTLAGLLREVLGNGPAFGLQIFPARWEPVAIFVPPPGAFLVIAFFIIIMNAIGIKTRQRKLVEMNGCDGCCASCQKACEKNGEVKES